MSAGDKLTYGDTVCLAGIELNGLLSSSGLIDERVRFEILDDGTEVPPNLDFCKFEVRIKYQYSSHKQKKEGSDSSPAPGGGFMFSSGGAVAAQTSSESESLQKAEQAFNNAEFLRSVGSPVLYGHVVQLFHVSSGKFVSVKRTQSELEKSHLKVVLQRRGDMGSWFTVTPAYKIKREGEHVAFGDAATFMSVKFSGAGLRLSDASFDVTVSGCHPYVIDSREVNAGPEVGRWKLIPYALHESKLPNARHLLRGSDAVVVTHRASEMHLVCDEGQVFFEARAQTEPGGRVSSNALWRLQPLSVEWGGRFASGDQPFHLKHLATGLYLESRRLAHSNSCLDMRGEDFRGMVGVTELYKKPGTMWRIGAVGQGHERHVIPYHTLIQCHGLHGFMSGGSGDYYKARWAAGPAAGSLSFASSFSAAAAAAAVGAVGSAASAADGSSGFVSAACVDADADGDGGEEEEEEALMGRRPAGLTSVWDQKDALVFEGAPPAAVNLILTESDSTRSLKNFVLALDDIDPIDDCTDDEVLKASIRTSGLIQVLFKYGPVVAEELQRLIRCLVVSDMPDVLNLRGPPNRTYQVFVSEQKVLAVVVSVLQILLISKGLPQRCLSDCDTFFEGFDLRRLCKLMNRFLQAACQQFRPGQDQLAPYVPLLDQLVGNEIYTSGTIMAIFADNERIISRVTVENIRQRVTNCRMFQRPRDIRFLNIICSSEGAPVRSNQNVVVDILRENADILVQARPAPSRLVRGGQTLILRRWDGLEVDCEAYADLQQLGPHSDSIRRMPQEVLFLFYVVSLELYCTLCLQRNRKAIDWLIEDSHLYGLDYATLRMVVFNPALPFFLRTNCCRLLTRMYLDREPFELVSQGSVMLTWPTIDDSDAETLTEPDHVNMAMADPFSAFPGKAPEREFGELKACTLAYLHGTRLSSACSAGQSALTLAVLQMGSIMLQFGLFGNFSQDWDSSIAQVVAAIIPLLDGRSEPWDGSCRLRFENQHEPHSSAVMEAKTIMCAMLMYIFDMRINWCISIAFDCYCDLSDRTIANFWDMPLLLSRPSDPFSSAYPSSVADATTML
ncbi:hypothetical protein CLOP_g1288 [Closterium sp. NIES-67]|nr:hypothetical protein CLOP_g1288 [Closterium sp. NIES-67]